MRKANRRLGTLGVAVMLLAATSVTADSLDMGAYRKAVEAMADRMVGHHMQMARFREQVLGVLTPDQRGKVRTVMQMMRRMMSEGMGAPVR